MKITAVDAYLLSFPLPDPLRQISKAGEKILLKRDAMLVRVSSDEGLTGYAPAQPTVENKQAIDRIIAPFLAGRTLDPDALRTAFQQGPGCDAGMSRMYSAVEIAVYDLAGKERGVAVSELVGGRVRDRIRLYGSAGVFRSPEEHAADALAVRSAGFSAFKMRAGRGAAQDIAAVKAVRDSGSADFDIMVDASDWPCGGYSRETIAETAAKLRDLRVRFLEEPLPAADHEDYARLRELCPLAAGRHEPSELRYLDLIQSGAVDYAQMDLVSQGGYATARRLFPDIARAGMRFTFSSFGTALETIAAAQLGVCWPESVVRWLEYPCYQMGPREITYPFPLSTEILKQPLTIERGDLIVPRAPGLGVEIDESVIWRYPWANELRADRSATL